MKTFSKTNSSVVKGFSILLLLNYHLFNSQYTIAAMEVNHSPIPLSAFLTFANFGNICVSLFVFMTAFGISRSLFSQKDLSAEKAYSQATRRFFTLMLNFFLLYLSVNLLWWSHFDYTKIYGIGKQGLLNRLLDALGLHHITSTGTLNVTWWYMKLAYLLIFLVPFLAFWVQKLGYTILLLSLMLPIILSVDPDVKRYLFTAVLGVCAAYGNWPEKLMNKSCPRLLQWALGIAAFLTCIVIRQNAFIQANYLFVVDAPICLLLLFFAGILLANVPLLKNVLSFIGRHSLNIYLVHTFFYLLLWREFIYSFRFAGITLLLLLCTSLLYSVILEWAKKWLQKGVRHLCSRLTSRKITR